MTVTDASDNEAQKLYDKMKSVIDQEGLPGQEAKEFSGIRLAFVGKNGRFFCFARAESSHCRITFYSIAPFVVPAERRVEMAQLLCRIHFGLPQGCFELDLDDGELRFRVSLRFADDDADERMIRQALWASVAGMDRYLPVLVSLSEQGLSPDKAIALLNESAAV